MPNSIDPSLKTDSTRPIHTVSTAEVYQALATRPEGLTQTEAEERLEHFGRNVIREVKGKPLWVRFLANFTHLMAILLWIGGAVAFIAHTPELGIAVWLVNIINGAFSFWQEYRAERATEALRRLLPSYVRVLRDGEERPVLAEELVPGDVILLAEGDRVSADCRLVHEAELRMDQSTLTGESRPVRKASDAVTLENLSRAEMPNLIFAGTSVIAGTGKAVAYATGMNTEFGQIAGLTQSLGDELSPIQKEMGSVTRVVTVIAVGIGVIFFVLAAVLAGITLADSFIFALGMIVAFVPEGLLPTVTLALAMGTQRMARRNALIKKLSAVETLGSTTVICTDKTGTLTQNEMTVRDIWLPLATSGHQPGASGGRRLTVTGIGYAPTGGILDNDQPVTTTADDPATPTLAARQALRELLLAAGLCNNSRLLPPDGDSPQWAILGDPTEAALKVAARKGGLDLAAEELRLPRLREIPFESRRKRMSTIHQVTNRTASGARRRAYVKGAPAEVLALCTSVWLEGEVQMLDDELRTQILEANDDYARAGLRVLAFARRDLPDSLTGYEAEAVEMDLTFLGLIAMMDPPRPEVTQAVDKCHRAGIRIVMITGDYGLTAESIARRIGITSSDGPKPRIVTGFELETMSEQALQAALQSDVIFARVAPEHKLRVVTTLQDMGHVVAVTGDGVNDAPALKKADIGVAMGVSGTDVAKEAADMILTDDNFASIVNAVEEGRAVYANIKKFTTYIFTSNTPEAVPFIIFAFSAARIPLALNVMHVLSIDLGTDLVPALALGAEAPEPGVMDNPPRSLKDHIITLPLLVRAYVWLGPIQSLAAMVAFYFQYWTHGYWGQWLNLPSSGPLYRSATAMALAAVVTTQIGNLFAQRAERISIFRMGWQRLTANRLLWLGIATELVLIFLIVYVPLLQEFIGTAPFPLINWLFLFAWTPSLLLVDEARKALERRRAKQRGGL
jgi:Ca2+-transporting ATPase